jgi:hypothetical protein
MSWDLVVKNVPDEYRNDLDYIVSMVDLPANTNPNFKRDHFRAPVPVKPPAEMQADGYVEHWIAYGNPYFAAKELTVLPGRSVTLRDSGPYGTVMLQGHGRMGVWTVETPALIRFGQLTHDEYFVSCAAALEGVTITNPSTTDPLVMLKHFGPNKEAAKVK